MKFKSVTPQVTLLGPSKLHWEILLAKDALFAFLSFYEVMLYVNIFSHITRVTTYVIALMF